MTSSCVYDITLSIDMWPTLLIDGFLSNRFRDKCACKNRSRMCVDDVARHYLKKSPLGKFSLGLFFWLQIRLPRPLEISLR